MSLADLFRPRWRHSDVAVRTAAVRALQPSETNILTRIARSDSDPHVREIAIKRLDDPDLLTALADSDLDEESRQVALEHAASLRVSFVVHSEEHDEAHEALELVVDDAALADVAKRAVLEQIREAALDRLGDAKALADVARQAKRDDVRLAAVGRIDDQAVLKGLALGGEQKEVALAALNRIEDKEYLSEVSKRAKVKSVRSRAKKRLVELRPAKEKQSKQKGAPTKRSPREPEPLPKEAKLVRLCQRAETLQKQPLSDEVAAQLAKLREDWLKACEEIGVDDALQARFDGAAQKLQDRFDVETARTRLKEAAVQKVDEVQEVKEVKEVEEDADAEKRQELLQKAESLDLDNPESELRALEDAFRELGDVNTDKAKDTARRFYRLLRDLREKKNAAQAREAARPKAEELLGEAEKALELEQFSKIKRSFGQVQREWARLVKQGLDDDLKERFLPFREKFRTLDEQDRLKQSEAKQALLEKVESITAQMKDSAESTNIRQLQTLVRDAKDVARDAGKTLGRGAWRELKGPFDEAERGLREKLDKLREEDGWQRHFNVRKLEELCEKVEALIEAEDLKETAQTLRGLQAEWKRTGPASQSRSEELWQRFKKASDQVYERCESVFQEIKEERGENLEKKQALCEQAEAVAESTEWKETAEHLKDLQAQWKNIGPVDRKDSDAVWKRFRAACDTFFGRRKEHFREMDAMRRENLTIKEGLCEKVAELAESSEWKETAEEIKNLQAEWKAVGPVPRKNSDAIWKQFRGSCDHFFARRDAHLDGGRRANLAQKNELCDELAAFLENGPQEGDDTTVVDKVLDTWREWKDVGPIPFDEVEKTRKRLEELSAQGIAKDPESFKGTELDPEANAAKREELCVRLEKLFESIKGSDEETEEQKSMAEKLQEAMERNAFPKESRAESLQQVEEQAKRIQSSFASAGPVPGEAGEALSERFETCMSKLESRLGMK